MTGPIMALVFGIIAIVSFLRDPHSMWGLPAMLAIVVFFI